METLYNFDCYPMPWTEIALGIDRSEIGNHPIVVTISLSEEERSGLVDMMCWAWNNEWFEKMNSEKVCALLIEKFLPSLHERIRSLATVQFCYRYPNKKSITGFGDFEIIILDEIVETAQDAYEEK